MTHILAGLEQNTAQPTQPADFADHLIRYYSEAGPDYGAWSADFNMHFGYYRFGMNPFRLEKMLGQMNEEVLNRLEIDENIPSRLLDLGCGLGATARFAAKRYPMAAIDGITIVPWQVEQAGKLAARDGVGRRVRFSRGDYCRTGFESGLFDGAYALESSCHAPGYGKTRLLREAYRLLKPGGRIVVADGFLRGARPLNPVIRHAYAKICDCWVIENFGEIGQFQEAMTAAGFKDIKIEDATWKIAPSTAYIPIIAIRFLFRELLVKRSKMTRQRWNHVIAPVLLPIIGLARRRFGYYLISARKP